MEKVDFRKAMKDLYQPGAGDFTRLVVPPLRFLMIDGQGDPNTAPAYGAAIEALYAASYGLKFASKAALGRDYGVPPLEGLWWAGDMASFTQGAKDQWLWTLMIMVPPWIASDLIGGTLAAVAQKKALPALAHVREETLSEGDSVQILHIGPYDAEGPVLARLHGVYLPAHGLVCNGKHHEIYLGDPRKTAAEKLKTVLRQPVKAAA